MYHGGATYDPYMHFTASHELINTKVQYQRSGSPAQTGSVQKCGQGPGGLVFLVHFDDGTEELLEEQQIREGNRNYSVASRGLSAAFGSRPSSTLGLTNSPSKVGAVGDTEGSR